MRRLPIRRQGEAESGNEYIIGFEGDERTLAHLVEIELLVSSHDVVQPNDRVPRLKGNVRCQVDDKGGSGLEKYTCRTRVMRAQIAPVRESAHSWRGSLDRDVLDVA